MNLTASEVIERAARRALKPRIFEPVWKWAERNVRLSVRTTNTPGKYDSGWITYTRGWQEAFSNPRVKEISICAAAQTGKTESILNCIRWAIADDPGPMLWIMPAESLARSFSETRLQPSLRDCPPCAEQIPDDPDAFKLLEMHFRDCTLNLVGANSPAQLASRPVRYLFADEIDKFPEAHAKEAGALELAKVRTTSFWNAKTILTSTPTVEGGQIWQAYLNGTRHKYFVKCPHCQHEQELLWPNVKWPTDERTKVGDVWNVDAVEKLAYYECPACKHHIEQNWRHTMIRGGQWKSTNPNAPADRVSFHLNALYSPWRTWGSIAREFLEVKDSFSGLQNFVNSVLAEPWKVKGETVTEDRLNNLRADYDLGACPAKTAFMLLTADVQRDCVYYVVRAWAMDCESWLVAYGRTPSLDDLIEIAEKWYPVEGLPNGLQIFGALIDSGFAAQQVYSLCAPIERNFFPAKGWDHLAQPVKEGVIQFLAGRNEREREIILIHFDDSNFKGELYLRRIQDRQGPPWHIARNTGPDYIAQLTREKLVEKKNQRGIPEQKCHQTHRDNHYADCEKLQLVLRFYMGQTEGEPVKNEIAKPD